MQNQLLLEKGEYKLSREADFRLARYQVTLPVSGDYARVRGFVNDVLEAVPSAALDELTLKRESVDQPELEARVRFSSVPGSAVMRVNPKLRAALLIGALALTLAAVRWADKLTDMTEASAGAVAEADAAGTGRVRGQQPPLQQTPALDLSKLRRAPVAEPERRPVWPAQLPACPSQGKGDRRPRRRSQRRPRLHRRRRRCRSPTSAGWPRIATATVFLAMGDRNLVVKPGDVIDNTYKLEEVSDSAVVLTYLPLSQRQTLSIGAP